MGSVTISQRIKLRLAQRVWLNMVKHYEAAPPFRAYQCSRPNNPGLGTLFFCSSSLAARRMALANFRSLGVHNLDLTIDDIRAKRRRDLDKHLILLDRKQSKPYQAIDLDALLCPEYARQHEAA